MDPRLLKSTLRAGTSDRPLVGDLTAMDTVDDPRKIAVGVDTYGVRLSLRFGMSEMIRTRRCGRHRRTVRIRDDIDAAAPIELFEHDLPLKIHCEPRCIAAGAAASRSLT